MIIVTGGRGFVGQMLIKLLQKSDLDFISLVRPDSSNMKDFEWPMPDIKASSSQQSIFEELNGKVDTIIHCAGLAHGKVRNASYEDYHAANVDLTEWLARFSLDVRSKKFIFLSTIGVHGRTSVEPVSELSPYSPYDHYSRSKLAAEKKLVKMYEKEKRSHEIVIIRPPLIVGSKAPGNFGKLIKLCSLRIPLPFGRINNRRTVLSIDNLTSFIEYALKSPGVSGVYTLADDEIMSTRDLIKEIRIALSVRNSMVPIPMVVMKLLSSIVGKRKIYEQLCEDLVVDSSKAKSQGWKPVVSSQHTIEKAARLTIVK